MPCKVVFFFNQFQRGWTETWYHNSTDPMALLDQTTLIIALNNAVTWRHQSTYLVAARATRLDTDKLTISRSYGTKYHGKASRTSAKNPDVTSTDAVIKVDGIMGNSKRMFIRGLIDDDVVRNPDGSDEPGGTLINGMSDYINSMAVLSYGLRVLVKPGQLTVKKYDVLRIVPVAGGVPQADIVTTEALGAEIIVGKYVRFSRVNTDKLPGFPLQAKVLELNPGGLNGVRISYDVYQESPQFPVNMGMMLQLFTVDIAKKVPEKEVQFERFSERKTGRPFGLQRGRARVKVKAL